jgi:glycosyltransferase involved in cell wall biosynthesis
MSPQQRNDTVAVVIPVFRAPYLEETLESVFSQTHPADAVILVDDGSPDRQVLARVNDRWQGRIRILTQDNAGAAAARNLGIRAAETEYIAFLDADDRWAPRYLETQLRTLASRADCDVVYSDAVYEGDTPLAGRRFMEVCPTRGEVTPRTLLALKCNVPLSASVVRRETLLSKGLFEPTLRRGHDFDLWLRLALRGVRFAWHSTVLMHYRVHADNLSGTAASRIERAITVFERALRLPLDEPDRALAVRQIKRFQDELALEHGKELIARGDFEGARRALIAVRRHYARWKVTAALIGLHVAPELVRRAYVKRAAL